MGLMDHPVPEGEIRVAKVGRGELAERVGRVVREEGTFDLPGGLRFFLC